MTAIRAIASVCLPFGWVMLANGPSRGATLVPNSLSPGDTTPRLGKPEH